MPRKHPVRKILFFGGAFDPPHKGHIQMLLRFHRSLKPSRTVVLPTFAQPVHKEASLFPGSLRLKMLKAALRGYKNIEVSDWELSQGNPVYTWQALEWLHRRFPGAIIHCLIGADNTPLLSSWGRIADIRKDPLVTFTIGRRTSLSSTHIRDLIVKKGVSARAQIGRSVTPPVLKMIFSPETLDARIHAYLKAHQPASRYGHTLSVARLALELSHLHGVDAEKARLAALLHDASRHVESFKNSREALGHAGRSVHLARKVFGVKDREILEAVAWHTTGNPGMGKLARLIYVADLASYDRKFKEAAPIRDLARRDLKEALKAALRVKLNHVQGSGGRAHPLSLRLWESLR